MPVTDPGEDKPGGIICGDSELTTKVKTVQAPASCAKCGACVPVCPLYKLAGRESLTARGKLHLLQKIPLSEAAPEYRRNSFPMPLMRGLQQRLSPGSRYSRPGQPGKGGSGAETAFDATQCRNHTDRHEEPNRGPPAGRRNQNARQKPFAPVAEGQWSAAQTVFAR